MRIVLAPDSFKGSLSATKACLAMQEGIRSVERDAEIVHLPMADGGEGTIESLVHALGGSVREALVRDPLGREVLASYGVLADGRSAVVEMAQASGHTLLSKEERNPLAASTYGTGQLISRCMDEGYRNVLLGLGGSATNDGGTGMMRALGVRFLDGDGAELPEGGGALGKLGRIDLSGLDPRLAETTVTAVTDVRNALCGDEGASRVFGPQKGATEADIRVLDNALAVYAVVVKEQLGIDVASVPGAGAAGGMGAGALAFLGAELRPGFELLAETYRFGERIKDADLIMTGEGRLDRQTLSGKVVSGVCRHARKRGVPVVSLCGAVALPASEMDKLGLIACLSIVPGPCELTEAVENAHAWTRERTEQLMRLIRLGGRIVLR
ncbi:glycerate kinase [Cohnella panacarvi]|uniref:glycerate kinase n=1 Tax=Cohnella panacarvi TaxID=400776 RepID=UPI00047E65E9|nr:glycerate kinase [Cohnella panacarvi]